MRLCSIYSKHLKRSIFDEEHYIVSTSKREIFKGMETYSSKPCCKVYNGKINTIKGKDDKVSKAGNESLYILVKKSNRFSIQSSLLSNIIEERFRKIC